MMSEKIHKLEKKFLGSLELKAPGGAYSLGKHGRPSSIAIRPSVDRPQFQMTYFKPIVITISNDFFS